MRFILLITVLAAAACGREDAPGASPGTLPPAELPADSAAHAPLPPDNTEALQPGDTARAGAPGPAATDPARSSGAQTPSSSTTSSSLQTPAASPPAAASDASDVAAILRRASTAYENVRSVRADFVMHREIPALRETITSRGTLYQRSPDRVALRFSDPDGDLILGDGQYFWVYYPSVNPEQYMRQPATEAGRSGVDLQAQFVGNPIERFEAELHGTESVSGRAAHVLTLVPRQRAEYRSLKVWLDTRDSLARQFEIVEHNGTTRRFELGNLQTNVSIPDAVFRFTPPPGARNITAG